MRAFTLLAGLLGLTFALPLEKKATSTWWYADQDHSLSNTYYNYGEVVVSINAGDGSALAGAVTSNGRPDFSYNNDAGDKYLSGAPRVIYLPSGTYELDSTLYLYTDTIILGDASAPPTIKPSSSFSGGSLIVGGKDGPGNGGELHFSVELKNVILDTSDFTGNDDLQALSWRVAQNSALSNVQIKMPDSKHTGIYLGQGSTISVSDVSFQGGNIGFSYDGHQQAELKGLTFNGCQTGIQISGGNSISIFGATFNNCKSNAISVTGINAHIAVIDGTSTDSGTIFSANGDTASLNFVIENFDQTGDGDLININGQQVLPGKAHTDTFVYGNLAGKNYGNGQQDPHQTTQKETQNGRPANLAPNGRYPIIKAPTYSDKTKADVINVKDRSQNGNRNVAGDNSNDDTNALQQILKDAASASKLVFFPAGVYKVTDTLTIPPGSQLIGEAWATISGFGEAFGTEGSPKAVVQVGEANSSGSASIQDMRFTVNDVSPGAIILQVNMKGANAGDVAIHNSLITLGGTSDTNIDCDDESQCRAALYGLHLAKGSSAYIDNFWSWVADHAADGASKGVRSAGKYGVVVEATDGTWLAGIGSEHWWNAQIFYNNAESVLTSFFQSETNYRQNNGAAVQVPAPFQVSGADPDYKWCNGDGACLMGANEYWTGGKNLYHYTAGSYNFNNGYQGNMYVVEGVPQNFQLYGTTTHMAYGNLKVGDSVWGGDTTDVYDKGAWGSVIAAYVDAMQSSPA